MREHCLSSLKQFHLLPTTRLLLLAGYAMPHAFFFGTKASTTVDGRLSLFSYRTIAMTPRKIVCRKIQKVRHLLIRKSVFFCIKKYLFSRNFFANCVIRVAI